MPEESTRPLQDLQEILLEAQSDIGQGFFVHEDGRPLYGNEVCSRITGYGWAELKALPSLFDLVVPEERAMLAERMRRRLEGEAVVERYETVIVHKSGRRVDVEVVAKPLEAGDRKRLVVLLRDVTERKRLEEGWAEDLGGVREDDPGAAQHRLPLEEGRRRRDVSHLRRGRAGRGVRDYR